MVRLLLSLLPLLLVASGLAWLSDQTGHLVILWDGYEIKTTLFRGIIFFLLAFIILLLLVTAFLSLRSAPSSLKASLFRKRQRQGFEVISKAFLALGAGDIENAEKFMHKARKYLPDENLTHFLEAGLAQISGDHTMAKRLFEAMLHSEDKEQLGLRNLYLLSREKGELEAAQHFAQRAAKINPKLRWSLDAQLEMECKASDWEGAIQTLKLAKQYKHIAPHEADRKIAVLMAAQALELEENKPDIALLYALRSHRAAPDLVPAAAVAGRILASQGRSRKASRILQKTWKIFPHPEIARSFAYARIGDSPSDRLSRMLTLAALRSDHIESALGIAICAIEAKDYETARHYLNPYLTHHLTCRVACLMARVEIEDKGDEGRMREWISKATRAGRDPTWISDDHILKSWVPVSPISGQIDAVQWAVPTDTQGPDQGLLVEEIGKLLELGVKDQPSIIEIEPPKENFMPDTYSKAAFENKRNLYLSSKHMLSFFSEKISNNQSPNEKEIVTDARIAFAPDDPGLDGEDLVPEIRTNSIGPKK